MKITKITPHLFFPGKAKNLLFCRIDTNEGLYGWGEAYVVQGKEKVVEQYIENIAPYLIGHSPFEIKHSENALFCDFALKRSSFDFIAAWSAIEIAMWDIVGKACNQPVYNLLGGKSRDKVRVYANGWWGGANTPAEVARNAKAATDLGYTAIKWDPFQGYWREYISKKQEDYAVEVVKQVREAVGPDVELMIEMHRRFSPYHAIHFSERIAQYDPAWIEEPCLADNIDLVAEVKRHIKTPVVTGETLYTKYDFIPVFEKRAADIINPDIAACNGISGLRDIATMAEPYNILVSPHNYNSTAVALAATCQVSLVIPNFNITEVFITIKEACDEIVVNPLKIVDGFIEVPETPGIGIDLDMEALAKHPYKHFERKFPFKGMMDIKDEYPCPANF